MSAVIGNQDTAFTPGPWRVIDDTDVLALEGTPSSIVVAATKFFEGSPTSWERANARLIAAAPELLGAAKALLEVINNAPLRSKALSLGLPLYERAADLLDVIAKAEGRES